MKVTFYSLISGGGVEDTRLEAKDTKKFQGQGHRRKCSQKKRSSKFFSGEKGLQNFFFRRSLLEETKTRSLQIFRKVSGVFQRNFSGSKIVLSSSRGWAIFEDLRLRRQGLENLSSRTSSRTSSRPRSSLRTPPLPISFQDKNKFKCTNEIAFGKSLEIANSDN